MNYSSISTIADKHINEVLDFRTEMPSRIRVGSADYTLSEFGHVTRAGKRKRMDRWDAIEVLAQMVEEGGQEQAIVRWMNHHARCALCGKALTATDSIERGMGPTCWSRFRAWVEANRPATVTVEVDDTYGDEDEPVAPRATLRRPAQPDVLTVEVLRAELTELLEDLHDEDIARGFSDPVDLSVWQQETWQEAQDLEQQIREMVAAGTSAVAA